MKLIAHIILYPFYLFYQLVIIIRNYLYDLKIFRSTKLPCKVISVGNITMGGTGKTPIVIALVKYLKKQNKKVAVLSRGYGRVTTGTKLVTAGNGDLANWEDVGDEPVLMAKYLSGVPIVVDENRVRGGKYLYEKFKPEVIILDDGFQHRKIYRDVDIVLINSGTSDLKTKLHVPEYYREEWNSLKRADLILITKSNLIKNSILIDEKLSSFKAITFRAIIIPATHLLDFKNNTITIDYLYNKAVVLFSGIGDPESFYKLIHGLNIKILDTITFRDHKKYSKKDLEKIRKSYLGSGADVVLTTEKDILKISDPNFPLLTLPITMALDEDGCKQLLKLIN